MSIKIHHGPNGSFKTSGAIQDDAIPALKDGRVIITNIRGFTLDSAYAVFPELPDTIDIINLSLESISDLEKMRNWFMWAPKGAFIIFDETQLVFPKSWREADLKKFDFPGGPEAAAEADRPMGWLDAWTRHRHFQWDIVLTTPNISYIRDDIRMTCEMAYRHSNLAVIGIPGRYKESQHDAQLNRAPAEGTVIEYKKIKKETFQLYQSTATGSHHDTKAGKSLLRSPKLLFLLVCISGLVFFSFSMGPISFMADSKPASAAEQPVQGTAAAAPAPAMVREASPAAAGVLSAISGGGGASAPVAAVEHPFAGFAFAINGYMQFDDSGDYLYSFELADPQGALLTLTSAQLRSSGYRITPVSNCVARVYYLSHVETVTCRGTLPASRAVVAPAGMDRQGMKSGAASGLHLVDQSSQSGIVQVGGGKPGHLW